MSSTDTTSQAAQILTTPEFQNAVHALAPRVAVFDCDGTLWSGDAGSSFTRWSIDQGLLSADAVAWLDERYRVAGDSLPEDLRSDDRPPRMPE